jgi:hypothetical protein
MSFPTICICFQAIPTTSGTRTGRRTAEAQQALALALAHVRLLYQKSRLESRAISPPQAQMAAVSGRAAPNFCYTTKPLPETLHARDEPTSTPNSTFEVG